MWFDDCANISLTGAQMPKNKAKTRNWREFWIWFNRLMDVGINKYKVSGDFPETLDPRTILQSFFFYDSVCLFRTKEGGVDLSLPGLPAADVTIYGYPRAANVFTKNGRLFGTATPVIRIRQPNGIDPVVNEGISDAAPDASAGEGYIIRLHKTFNPLFPYAAEYAYKIADTMRTIEVLANKLKSPYVIFAAEEMRKTVLEYFRKIVDNEDLVIPTGIFDPAKVKLEDTTINPDAIKAARELVEWYISQYMEIVGLNSNPASDKQERLLVDEINSNNQQADINVDPVLDYVNDQLDQASEFFGWSMKLERSVEQDDRGLSEVQNGFGNYGSEPDLAGDGNRAGSEID